MQADLAMVWLLLIVGEPVEMGYQLWWSSIRGRRNVSKGSVSWGQIQECAAGTLGPAPGHLHGTQVPATLPARLSEHCWLCYANEERWISHFPQPGFAQLCIYYPPLKIQSPQRRGMAHFYLFASRVGTDLSSNHPGLWSAKLPFVVRVSHPPRLFTRHTQTSARLKTSYILIRQNLSAWMMKMLQHLQTSHQINLELRPQHLVLILISRW